MKPQFLIGGIALGSGKTTFMLGLMRVLRDRGLSVQPFKCGPEMMDRHFHSLIADRESVNLDAWLSGRTHLQHLYNRFGEGADACVVDGQLALFDGYRKYQGSSAEIASFLRIPVILVINARVSSYSLTPILYGFKRFYSGIKVAGVVFNQVNSASQYAYLKSICADAGLEAFGYLPFDAELKLPSRHAGLTLNMRKELETYAEKVARMIESTVELNKLLNLTHREFPCRYTLPYTSDVESDTCLAFRPKLKIAVARDLAFHALYPVTLKRFSQLGTLSFFSPVYGNELPEADILYLPDGCQELFARQLHRRRRLMDQIKQFAEQGGKILAEGGALAFLGNTMATRIGGTNYNMVGLFPFDFVCSDKKPQLGYREIPYNGMALRGYECNYNSMVSETDTKYVVANAVNLKGQEVNSPLYRYKNVLATPVQLYLGETEIEKLWL